MSIVVSPSKKGLLNKGRPFVIADVKTRVLQSQISQNFINSMDNNEINLSIRDQFNSGNRSPSISSFNSQSFQSDSTCSPYISNDAEMNDKPVFSLNEKPVIKSPSMDSVKTVVETHNIIQTEFSIKEIKFHVNSITSLKFSAEDFVGISEFNLNMIVGLLLTTLSGNQDVKVSRRTFSHYSNYKFRLITDEINCISEIAKQTNDDIKSMMENDSIYFKNVLQTIFDNIKNWIKENLGDIS